MLPFPVNERCNYIMARKKTVVEPVAEIKEEKVETAPVEPVKAEPDSVTEAKERNQRKLDIPNNYEIPVKSNVAGGLTYVSRRNKGLEYRWERNGDVEYIEYSELVSMRNTQRKFFENNWVIVEDSDYTAEDVYRALSIQKYYEFNLQSIDDVFSFPEKTVREIAAKASKGLKDNIIQRARYLYSEGSDLFDSSKRVKMFEDAFNMVFEEEMG